MTADIEPDDVFKYGLDDSLSDWKANQRDGQEQKKENHFWNPARHSLVVINRCCFK